MDPKLVSGDVGSASDEDMLHLNDFSMLGQFIYDTSSFSDRLVQLAAIDPTTESPRAEDHEPASGLAEVDNTDGKKNPKSTGNSFYPGHLVVEGDGVSK